MEVSRIKEKKNIETDKPSEKAYQESYDPKILKKNILYHTAEGGFYIGGSSFIAPNCVLPRIVELLGGPAWVISLAPALTMIGFNALPIMLAHRVETMKKVRPLLNVAGFFQRLPFFIAALMLIFLSSKNPLVALIAVVSAPLLSGAIGGVTLTAWQELFAKTIPNKKRSSVFAGRNIVGSVIGISAGGVIAAVLGKYPGVVGYGILYLISFGFLLVSFILFLRIREPIHEHRSLQKRETFRNNLILMLRILKSDGRLRKYLGVTVLTNATSIVIPFLPIFSLRVTGHADSFLGALVTAQMIGAIIGNAISGYVGDRHGGKTIMVVGRIVIIVTCVAIGFLKWDWAFAALFFIQGAANSSIMIGAQTMNIELCPYNKRSTYLAVMALVNVPAVFFFSFLGSWLWDHKVSFSAISITAAAIVLVSTILLLRIPEPRKATIV